MLGLITGVGMVLILFAAPKFAKNKNPYQQFALSFVGLFVSTLVGLGVLYAYRLIAHTGFIWFGVSAVIGYFCGLAWYSVQNIREMSDGKN